MSAVDSFRSFLNVQPVSVGKRAPINPAGVAALDAAPEVAQPEKSQNAFVTFQSLTTFSGASLAISILWVLLKSLIPNSVFIASAVVPGILTLLWGVFTVYMDATDPQNKKNFTRNCESQCGGVNQ